MNETFKAVLMDLNYELMLVSLLQRNTNKNNDTKIVISYPYMKNLQIHPIYVFIRLYIIRDDNHLYITYGENYVYYLKVLNNPRVS